VATPGHGGRASVVPFAAHTLSCPAGWATWEVLVTATTKPVQGSHLLLPVLPLRDVCLFPEAHLTVNLVRPPVLEALAIGRRAGGRLLALAQKDPSSPSPAPANLHEVGTVAELGTASPLETGRSAIDEGSELLELIGQSRGRVVGLLGTSVLIAEVELLEEGSPGDEWGPAVEALARYIHAHSELRSFLDEQRRSNAPMAWVNLACQHLPITATARQRLLACDAAERCAKISRGLDALLRKEQSA